MTQDTAEIGLMTLTERSQNNQLKEEATRSKADLLTQKGLLRGSITRFKTTIRNFHLLEENGLSTQNFSLEIGSAYDNLRTELEELVNKWDKISPTGEIDWEIIEYWKTVDRLKSKNLDISKFWQIRS